MNNLQLTPWVNNDPNYNYAAFCVEISDNVNYFTSTSSGDCWCTCSEDVITDLDKKTALKGETYKVTVSNHDNMFEITYTNRFLEEQLFGTLSLVDTSSFTNPLYVQVLSQVGTLTVKNSKNDTIEVIEGREWWNKSNRRSTQIELADGETIEFTIEVDNDNGCGFYEYECWYNGGHFHARTLEDLQSIVREEYKKINEAYKTAKRVEGFMEQYEQLSDEEKREMTLMQYYDKLNARELTEEELKELEEEHKLFDENVDILSEPDAVIQHFDPTTEDLKELRNLVEECPNLSPMDLEYLYYDHTLTDVSAKFHLASVENAKQLAEQYSSDLDVSELLCEMYEKQLELETQLVSTSEEIVDLYESK